MTGRVYTVPFENISLTNDSDQDLFEMVMGSGVSGILHEFRFESALTTDERVRWRLLRRSTTGSGGTGCTEVPVDQGNTVAAACAVSQLVTTPGTVGAILDGGIWSQLAPLIWLPTPEVRPIISPSGRLCLNILTAVGSTRSVSGYLKWEEVG